MEWREFLQRTKIIYYNIGKRERELIMKEKANNDHITGIVTGSFVFPVGTVGRSL